MSTQSYALAPDAVRLYAAVLVREVLLLERCGVKKRRCIDDICWHIGNRNPVHIQIMPCLGLEDIRG